ncbi:MAG: LysR substrate-binding domain-containing protein [Pseudomonadota bacterium]
MRTLIAFSETGSFTKSAERVNRTQSAVSMQMRRLEEQVGRPLFERQGREMHLTADGRTLVSFGRRILKIHEEAVGSFAEPKLTGTIKVGTPDDYALTLLPTLFSRFAESYPDVHLEVHCAASQHLRERLSAGDLDIAIMTCNDEAEAADGIVLTQDPVVWATSETHDVHLKRPLPLALYLDPCQFRNWGFEALDRADIPYRVSYSSSNMYALFGAVLAGLAVTIVAQTSMVPGMRVLRPDEGFPSLPVATIALFQAGGHQNRAGTRLVDHIVDSFRSRDLERLVS